MFDYSTIMSRLRNGEDAGNIAQEMADLLNGAIDAKREEDEKAKAEAAKANSKLTEANEVAATVLAFAKKWYPDLVSEDAHLTGEDLCTVCAMYEDIYAKIHDPLMNLFDSFSDLFDMKSNYNDDSIKQIAKTAPDLPATGKAVISWDTPEGKGTKTIDMSDADADSVIADFLRNLGI